MYHYCDSGCIIVFFEVAPTLIVLSILIITLIHSTDATGTLIPNTYGNSHPLPAQALPIMKLAEEPCTKVLNLGNVGWYIG